MDNRTLQKRKEYLETVSKNIEKLTSKKYTISYKPRDKSDHNGDAAGKGKITIKGEWGDFTSDIRERCRLYYVIGHEMGHKDHEPPMMMFWDFLIMFALLIVSIATFCNGIKLVGIILFVILIIYIFAFSYCEKSIMFRIDLMSIGII